MIIDGRLRFTDSDCCAGWEISGVPSGKCTTSQPLKEGNTSVLRHAARLKIDFGIPVFNWIHLNNFEGRLSLQKGETTYKAKTAYSTTHINTWLAHGKNIWVLECDNLPNEAILGNNLIATISLERLGSRAFAGWYAGYFPASTTVGIW